MISLCEIAEIKSITECYELLFKSSSQIRSDFQNYSDGGLITIYEIYNTTFCSIFEYFKSRYL